MVPGAVSHRARGFTAGPEAMDIARGILAASEDAEFGKFGPSPREGGSEEGAPQDNETKI